ncbi:hypothetical protein M8C21_019929, partial [Ambrosia artemisiifolia]
GSLRSTEQGEMVQAKFGIPGIAVRQLEVYTTAVLLATLSPPKPPRDENWRNLMDQISQISCKSYRNTVYENPEFLAYFQEATPQAELGNLNIGSRPTRRKTFVGIGHLRAIPWIFAWTQTRFVLPAWLGVGAGLKVLSTKVESEPECQPGTPVKEDEKAIVPVEPIVHEEKPVDDTKAIAIVESKLISNCFDKMTSCRNNVLAKVATEKKDALIKAWEESEKSKAENKAQQKLYSIGAWENSKKADLEAELKKIEEKKKAKYIEKMKNKMKKRGHPGKPNVEKSFSRQKKSRLSVELLEKRQRNSWDGFRARLFVTEVAF